MNMRISLALFMSLAIPLFLLGAWFTALPAHAQTTEERIDDQTLVVQTTLVETLQEYVTLLQLVAIDRLEAQVASLEARLSAQ